MSAGQKSHTSVLIVGAGPTGLVLALMLARKGVSFRIVSQANGPGEHSRAMVVHARTLEFYRQFGFADEVINSGIKVGNGHLREGGDGSLGREVGSFSFRELGLGLSPYPFPLTYPQDDHERLLLAKLNELGVEVEWRSKLLTFTQDNAVKATIRRDLDTDEIIEADYICGCDGAHSAVRETLKVGFEGGTYPQLYYVADIKVEGGFKEDLYINIGEKTFALLLPVRSTGMQRLIGLVPATIPEKPNMSYEDIRAHVEPMVDARAQSVNWFSTYRVHHRVAEKFQVDRAFLLGDAGHVHSPTGGQGMNTGIGDAINLGWKLAMVARGQAPASILATYEPERLPFARKLVKTTDTAFAGIVAGGLVGTLTRRVIIPLAFMAGSRIDWARHALFRTVAQIEIAYYKSPLSSGHAGQIQGGDRLPWVQGDKTDNFETLRSLDWQVHVYGTATSELKTSAAKLGLSVHEIPWTDAMEKAGFKRDGLYLVRPDGHVALACSTQGVRELQAYINERRLQLTSSRERT